MKNTIRIYGKVYNCEIVNNMFIHVNGAPVMISWKQGQYGKKVYITELSTFECNTKKDGSLALSSYWNNSNRQVKDAAAYLISATIPEPETTPTPDNTGKVFYKGEYRDIIQFGTL